MANLKDLRNSIASVKSTQRITSAMKMVAAAKLRKAQDMAEAARPYAERMERMLSSLATSAAANPESAPPMLAGTGKDDSHLLIVVSSDRGLCGGFNSSITRDVRQRIARLEADGKTAKLIVIGKKGVTALRRDFADRIVATHEEISKPSPSFDGAALVSQAVADMFAAGEFDVCTLVYSRFVSALTQIVTPLQLIPFTAPESEDAAEDDDSAAANGADGAVYEFEPDEEEILAALLPRNLSVQVFRSMLESFASEQGARMTAMDSATRNAGDMIDKLTTTYNRTRQAAITKELIEIISGAEAL
ncbi:MAG: F0F1 ATP synthase subunit gamma [Rhodospirillaceae bacterium]|jgi:F-type H+-transporting ATPase subunit gamma|nr:F0F1 ATP synthase subunit gamma [Rhodospirillaceae bacterium]MBT5667326.1 F0F1 ATP synthase subunit gamma [Rhodospirillaceae bacterium]MBT5809877.1 F0F1 ATP synthase subunit gamma [Rhodospirillaceae bacterium]